MITRFKLFENREIKQQPFFLGGSFLYISDEVAHRIAPTLEELKKGNEYLYQNQLHFFNN